MTPEVFLKILNDSSSNLNDNDNQIINLVRKYPYAGILRCLHAKSMKEKEDENFSSVLFDAAIYSGNRKKLYDYLNLNKQSKIISLEKKNDELEQNNFDSAVLIDPPQIFNCIISENPPFLNFTEIEQTQDSQDTDTFPYDFKEKINTIISQGKNQDKAHLKEGIEDIQEFISVFSKDDDTEKTQANDVKANELNIFERFNNESLSFLNEVNNEDKNQEETWSDSSIEQNNEIISENLAKLLAIQGQKIKAIQMYKSLSLKFPKKSRFFAEQIKKLENNI